MINAVFFQVVGGTGRGLFGEICCGPVEKMGLTFIAFDGQSVLKVVIINLCIKGKNNKR